jgi:hypothetical protein
MKLLIKKKLDQSKALVSDSMKAKIHKEVELQA